MGILLKALASAVASPGLTAVKALELLRALQRTVESYEPDGPEEPMLISVPASRASDLAFPFAVIEGKAYSTGKQVFEAENRAAVSGACALKIQLRLDELGYRELYGFSSSASEKGDRGLVTRSPVRPRYSVVDFLILDVAIS